MATTVSQHSVLDLSQRRRLGLVMALAVVVLAATVFTGLLLERSERTPLIQVGQTAPDFTLNVAGGGTVSLAEQRGHPVLLAFVPSVQCRGCQDQLRLLETALPDLTARGVAVFVISTDEPAVELNIAQKLHLTYPFLAEDVVIGRHPAGHAYGVYHLSGVQQGPVDANALFLIDAGGTVGAVDVRPAGQLGAEKFLTLVVSGLGQPKGTP